MRLAALLVPLALSSTPVARADGPTPVDIAVGDTVNVCSAGLARCPALTSLCDDPKIATIELGPSGPELRGVSPGTTLCSVVGSNGLRRVMRVTVKARQKP